MMVVTSSTVAENAVCWCDGRKTLRTRCTSDREFGVAGLPGWLLWLDWDETVSDEACIKGDSTRNLLCFRVACAEHFTVITCR
jgi:hypothetical protein